MSHHPHPAHQPKHEHASAVTKPGMKPHIKWGLLIAVILMLVALAIYVLTNDESVQPGKPVQQTVPVGP